MRTLNPIMFVDSRAISAAQLTARIKARNVCLIDLRSKASGEWAPANLRRRLEHLYVEMPYLRVADIGMTATGTIALLRCSQVGVECLKVFAEDRPLALLHDVESQRHREALTRVLRQHRITPKLFQF